MSLSFSLTAFQVVYHTLMIFPPCLFCRWISHPTFYHPLISHILKTDTPMFKTNQFGMPGLHLVVTEGCLMDFPNRMIQRYFSLVDYSFLVQDLKLWLMCYWTCDAVRCFHLKLNLFVLCPFVLLFLGGMKED